MIALSKTAPNAPGRWARQPAATAAQTGRDDHVLNQVRGVFAWVPLAKPEVRVWVQLVYLRSDPWNESKRRESEKVR